MVEHSMCQPGRPGPHGGVPRRLARLGRLPEREVDRAALGVVDLDPGAGRVEELLEGPVRERPVVGVRGDVEVDALAVDDVGVVLGDELGDPLDHGLDVLGGVGDVVGSLDAEPFELLEPGRFEAAGQLRLARWPSRGRGR